MPLTIDGTKPREEQLIQCARRGDRRAFDELVTRYQDYVYRLMVRACHHPQDAEEVAMDAFARAYQRLAQFEGRSSFVSWLGRIATNLCLKRRRRVPPESVPLDAAESSGGRFGGTLEPSPEELAMRDELKCKIQSAVDELPEPERTVLRLRDIEQCSAKEVSDRLGLTVPAVKARLHRARVALRERLNEYLLNEEDSAQAA